MSLFSHVFPLVHICISCYLQNNVNDTKTRLPEWRFGCEGFVSSDCMYMICITQDLFVLVPGVKALKA